jgi:hypothetical protein
MPGGFHFANSPGVIDQPYPRAKTNKQQLSEKYCAMAQLALRIDQILQ